MSILKLSIFLIPVGCNLPDTTPANWYCLVLRWRLHPDRVASIKSMSASELSRRRLKTYVSDPPLPSDDAEMEASRQEEELEDMVAEELADPAVMDMSADDSEDGCDQKEHGAPAEDDTLEYEASVAGSECGNSLIDDGGEEPCGNESPAGDDAGDDDSDDATDGEGFDA